MFKKVLGGGMLAAVAVGVVVATPASADSTFAHYGHKGDYDAFAYRDELRYVGINHEDAHNAGDLAGRLCNERAEGYSEYQVAYHLDQSPDGYTTAQEVAMVAGAEYHFCPQYLVLR
jgi:hypothetical protein